MKIGSSQVLLILIAVGFTSFALVDWFWIMPKGIWEYNFAEKFFVSSIFTVLTIILLNLLTIVWEQRIWGHVKKKVYSMIQEELGILFILILDFIENGLMIKASITKENAFSELCKLNDAKEPPKLNTASKELFEDKTSIELFMDIAQNLNNVEIKYSRFLTPKLNDSLINIQDSLRLLRYAVRLYHKNIREPLIVSSSFGVLIKEIYKIHREGIEFSPLTL